MKLVLEKIIEAGFEEGFTPAMEMNGEC